MKIRCIAIDDEAPALTLMENFAGKIPFLKMEATFTNPSRALEYIQAEQPELVFLDINMPDIKGTEFAKSLPTGTLFIFCTAYNEFAVEGFELKALDYLVKPFSFERFLAAVCQAQEQLMLRQKSAEGADVNDFIFIRSEYSQVKLKIADIQFVEGLKDYIKVYSTGNPKPLLSLQSLRSLEEILPMNKFCRVHRSFIVNLDFVDSIQRNIVNIGNREIPIGSQFKEDLTRIIDRKSPK
jgi:DNA-binding LytR/AlgR family response regulator